MKRFFHLLMFVFFTLVCSSIAFCQDIKGSRVIATQALYPVNGWITGIYNDTTLLNGVTDKIVTPNAIYDFVVGRVGSGGGGGGGTWGSITGTLSNQTDLQTALNAKQNTITFGTGVQTALGVNIGSAGAPVLFNGAGGTPSSMVGTNITGTASGLSIGGSAPAGSLTGTTLAANVVTSSLTSVGTLTGGATGAGFTIALGSSTITGDLPFANLTQGSARSVLGVTGNATADFASIQGTANQVLVINSAGTALAFGQVNLSSSAAVTGTLPSSFTVAHGIDDVLAVGQALSANRTIVLGGNTLAVENSGNTLIRASAIESRIIANDGTFEGGLVVNADSGGPDANFSLSIFNGTNDVRIEGDAVANTLDYTADTNTFNGAVIPGTDDTYALGDDTHRWADIFLGPASIHIGTSTSDEGLLSYNTTTNELAITSTGAVTINGNTFTAGTGTLTIAAGKTLTASNTITFTATDGSTLAIGTGGTLGTNAYTSTAYAPLASPTFTGTVTIPNPFTLGATSVTTTGIQLNYLNAATGTTGTTSSNLVFSATTVFTGTTTIATLSVTGFSTLAGGLATNTTAGNANAYVTGGITANRTTTASYLPLSAAGLGLRSGVNGSTAYTMTASDAFGAFVVATTGGVTEASSGTHPIVASAILRPITVTNGTGATDILAGLYIEGPATGVTPATASYGIWLDAGQTRLDGNVLIGGAAAGTSATTTLAMFNGTVPSTSPADGIQLYSEDVAASAELKVRDEAGNITTISPHAFVLTQKSEPMAWSYHSINDMEGKEINVDMLLLARLVEKLTGEKLVYIKNLKTGEIK